MAGVWVSLALLRDAQLLALALPGGDAAGELDAALARFADDRDRIVGPIFDVVDRIAGYRWDPAQLRRHLLDLSSAMSRELEELTSRRGGGHLRLSRAHGLRAGRHPRPDRPGPPGAARPPARRDAPPNP
jgi:hypothetical protein